MSNSELIRRVWSLSWPAVIWSALEASLGLADLVMVRSLGAEATAAVGISRQVTFLVDSVVLAIASGIIAVVSQAVGSKRWETVNQVARQSSLLLISIAFPMGIVGAFATTAILHELNADSLTIGHAAPYLQIYFLGIVFSWANVLGAAFFRSMGDALIPLKLAAIVACLNLPLNYLLIHGLGPFEAMGVQGAALGTVLAKLCGTVIYFVLLRRRMATHAITPLTTRSKGFDKRLIGRILRIGTPMALAGLVRNGARLVFLAMVGASSLGMTFHAAIGVGLQVRLLSVLPALGFQVATATLVGQAIGRNAYDEAQRLGRRSLELLAIVMLVIVVAIIIFAEPLAQLLVADASAAACTATVLRWFAVAQFFSSLNITVQGALLGAGDTLPNLRYTFITQWIVMLPLAYVTSRLDAWQLHGPLAAWLCAPILLLLLLSRRFRSDKWGKLVSRGLDS